MITDDFEFLSEQVSHHPPITAAYCKGKKSNYVYWTNQKTNTKFNGKGMDFTQQYRSYIDLEDHNERFEIQSPTLSVHNLIVGTMYIDMGGTMKVRILQNSNLHCQIKFHKRGWVSKEICKCDGEVYELMPGKSKKHRMLYKVQGNWNGSIYVTQFMPD